MEIQYLLFQTKSFCINIMEYKLNISDIDKALLLSELYNAARISRFFIPFINEFKYKINIEEARRILNETQGKINKLYEKSLFIDISSDYVDPWYYDKEYGIGTIKKIIQRIKMPSKSNIYKIDYKKHHKRYKRIYHPRKRLVLDN